MEHLDDPVLRGANPKGSPMSSDLLAWVENPWRRHMLRTHLIIVATGRASPAEFEKYLDGLSAIAETHNIERADRVLPCIMYIPRIYTRAHFDEVEDARGLEWFTEEQVASVQPSLFVHRLTMPIISASLIMQAGAAGTVLASEADRENRWHVIQGPYNHFPLPNLRRMEVNEDWGMLPLVTPGAHVVAPVNLLQLGRTVDGPMPFRLGYASSARMLVGDFKAWYTRARESGVVVSIHRLHPRDIEALADNEISACSETSNPEKGRWLGPFDHFAAREIAELLLSSGVRTGTSKQESLHENESWVQELQGAIASLRHHILQEWTHYFNAPWMGASNFELNPLALKMRKVVASVGEVGLQRLKKNQDPRFWLEHLEECQGSFAELQLWYGQIDDSKTLNEEVELAAEIGPYPLGRFVSEWGTLPGLKQWLEDADGEVVKLTEKQHYRLKTLSNRPLKKVLCSIPIVETMEEEFAPANIAFTFLEWLKKVEAIYEVGAVGSTPAFRRRGGSWYTFESREELQDVLGNLDMSTFLQSLYENHLMPKQWKPELQAVLLEILGLVVRQWNAPFAPLCVHQFLQAIREALGFRDEGNWQETLANAHHLASAQLEYLVDIWWPDTFNVYRTEMSWVLEIDHGVGLVTRINAEDDRIHAANGFDIIRYACGFPARIGWSLHPRGIIIGTDTLESLFTSPTAQTVLRLARPHCAAEAWAASDLKDALAAALGITFEFHLGPQGTLPMIELRGPKRRLRSLLRLIPGFSAAGVVGYSPPPALREDGERRTGQCWVWTQAQLRSLASNYCLHLHENVGIPWDGQTKVLARAAADAVILWGVVQHGLKCSATVGGEWLPKARRANNGFCWDQPLELGPVIAVHHSGADVFLLVTPDKALQWQNCLVSRITTSESFDRARLVPKDGATIVSVGSGEKPDGAFQRPLLRVEVGELLPP